MVINNMPHDNLHAVTRIGSTSCIPNKISAITNNVNDVQNMYLQQL